MVGRKNYKCELFNLESKEMKTLTWLYSLVLCGFPIGMGAQVTDRILLGDVSSEEQHGLTVYCPDKTQVVTDGLMGQSGRNCLRFEENPFAGDWPGIYGGEYCFVLKVDGNRQNYLTLRTNGGDGVTMQERYRVQVNNKDLQDYSRDAVSFDAQKAPGAFAYSTLIIPRSQTDGKTHVVVRVRAVGRYYGYGRPGEFATYQRVMEGDMPPVYAVYSTTNPMFGLLADEVPGKISGYEEAPMQPATDLDALKEDIRQTLNNTIASEISGYDFKPAYGNNNFNIVEAMGTAYQKGYYGTTPAELAAKIRVAIDSMVYINNLTKSGVVVSRSVLGNSATEQKPSAGWGGLYGEQGFGLYQLWRAGQVTDYYLDQVVDLGGGTGRTRREQWIEAFRESFDYGCTLNGRRTITNQAMEAACSVYGACLALYALDNEQYHNAPRLGLRFVREAVGVDVWSGVPADCTFDGRLKDAEGYLDFQLGDSCSTDTRMNFWGINFQVMTEKGNGREAGWTCSSCYGNMGPRIIDLYLMTQADPYIGKAAGGNGDAAVLAKAVANEKTQAYFTYPWVAADGCRQIDGESVMCWRNRYDPGKAYYNNLIVAGISGDEELLGHVWQSYLEGRLGILTDRSSRLFNYYSRTYYLPECIETLQAYGQAHGTDYTPMPSVPGEKDYVQGDEQAGIVAVKHGGNHLFVNFYSESSLGSCGRAHLITETEVRNIGFVPDVMEYVPSGQTETIADVYWNGNHKITYPDNPVMADGGTVYDIPAYDGVAGHYNSMRTMCEFYQQQLGAYLIAQNTTADKTYPLQVTEALLGTEAVDIATGESITLTAGMQVPPRTTVAYYLPDVGTAAASMDVPAAVEADVEALSARVSELLEFAREASRNLSEEQQNGKYSRDAYMPFFSELTFANYVAHAGTFTGLQADSVLAVLNRAYEDFAGTYYVYDCVELPGTVDYNKKVAQSGALQIKSSTSLSNAMNGAYVLIPVMATQTGDYTVTVQARGHVYDEKEPSLNLALYTDEDYWNDDMPVDASKTRQIAYAMLGYSDYQWYVHLEAGESRLLKLTFLANTSGYTVDLGRMTFALSTLFDRLQQQIVSADSLLLAYAASDLVGDADRNRLSAAIAEARSVSSGADDAVIQQAYNALTEAMERFLQAVAEWKYPVADIQFRVNNTSQTGDGATFEVRNSSSDTRDNGFVGGIKFDISALAGQKVVAAALEVTTLERGCQVSVRPFSTDWGEAGGTTDSYASKEEYIREALAADEIARFSAALGGGRKMFEWIPSRDYMYTVKDWRVSVDVTDYLVRLLDGGQEEAAFLLAPADGGSTRTTIVCKDASEATFGTSTTDDYYLSGELMGQKTGQTVTRWSRVMQVLDQDGSPVQSLFPQLLVTLDGTDGLRKVVVPAGKGAASLVDVWSVNGVRLKGGVPSGEATDGLQPGIYIVDGRKVLVRRK